MRVHAWDWGDDAMTDPASDGSCIAAGPGGATLRRLSLRADAHGSLAFAEVGPDLPFTPRRMFTVWDVPSGTIRGRHAHRVCQQFLVCTRGSVRVLVEGRDGDMEFTLDSPRLGLYLPPMVWAEQRGHSHDASLLVLASHAYDGSDYIRDHDEFLAELRRS